MKTRIITKLVLLVICFYVLTITAFCVQAQEKYIFKFKDSFVGKFEDTIFGNCTKLIDNLKMYLSTDKKLCELLKKLEIIEYYEKSVEVELFSDISDPIYLSSQYSHQMLGSPFAWQKGLFGNEVTIALIDSGISPHNDINANILPGYNTYAGGTDCTDTAQHGTYVAGVIASEINGIGTVGIAPKAKIIPIKCFNGKTTGVEYIVSAIGKAIELDVDIINMSFGTKSHSDSLKEAIEAADKAGIITIAAVGNLNDSTVHYPAAYDCVIGVGNIDQDKNAGNGTQFNDTVYVTAPGTKVYSTSPSGDGYYAKVSGTSFACPAVAGACALALSINPALSRQQFQTALKNTSIDYGAAGYDTTYGYGILNIQNLTNYLLNGKKLFISPIYKDYNGNRFVNVTNLENQSKTLYGGIYFPYEIEKKALNIEGNQTAVIDVYNNSANYSIVLGQYFRKSKTNNSIANGDINNDGMRNNADTEILTRYIINPKTDISSYHLYRANLNNDEYIDLRDLVLME